MLGTLQAGRAAAAIAVVMFHLSIAMGDARYGGVPVFGAWTSRGNLGVDFFFVMSGFIMMYIHQPDIGRPERWRPFARARFLRLYPVYWIYSLGFCFLVALGFGTATTLPDRFADWFSAFALVRLTDVQPPLGVAWTLFHEIAFYALFSILIVNRRAGMIALGLWMAAAILALGYSLADAPAPVATYVSAYNLDFLIGIGACFLARHATMRQCGAAFWGGIALLLLMVAYESDGRVGWGVLVYGFAFGGIVGGMAGWELKGGATPSAFARLLGDASYTIYLIHVPVIGLLLKLVAIAGVRDLVPAELVYGMVLVAGLAVALAAYHVVERPLQAWLKRRRRHARRLEPVAAIS